MSYPKAIRVVEAISTRYADQRVRLALAEVKAVIQALDAVAKMPGGGVPEPIEATLARAAPDKLPCVAAATTTPAKTTARSEAATRASRHKDAWPEGLREAIFEYLGEGHDLRAAEVKFGKSYGNIRNQCLKHPKDVRLQHLTMFRSKIDV